MASEQFFSGSWTVEVYFKDAAFSERFVISGSDKSDGIYLGEVTTPPILVSGPRWFLRFEWNNNAGSGWQASDLRRIGASYTLQDGLVTFLGADDNLEALRDHDFNDLVLRCRNRDLHINPRIPLMITPDFTLPGDIRNRVGQNNDHFKDHSHGGHRDHRHHHGHDNDHGAR